MEKYLNYFLNFIRVEKNLSKNTIISYGKDIEKNFASEVENAKIDKRLPKVMTVNETANIIDSADSTQDRAILETIYGLGCRVSELVNIKISDINFEDRTVRLFGKGNKERIVPINNASISAILEHIK